MSDPKNEPPPLGPQPAGQFERASDSIHRNPAMHTKTAGYLIFYGCFLIVMGLLGYLSNPEKARTALMSGGTFGALSILWGVLLARGVRWSLPAAVTTTGLLAVVFVWRASVGWLAVLEGQAEKRFAAGLITVMLAASIAMLLRLIKTRKTEFSEKAKKAAPVAPAAHRAPDHPAH